MAGRKFQGVRNSDEFSALRKREDIRPFGQKVRDWWLAPDGQRQMLFGFIACAVIFIWMPLSGEFILLFMALFALVKLRYTKMKWDFPLRIPISADLIDASTNKKGKGIFHLGAEVRSRMPASISDNDARTHGLIFGTTGSGKTELLLGFVVNSLVFNGGSSYTDGKGDVKLWLKFLNAARMLGREKDLLLVSFITSGKEFYDRQESPPSNTLNPYAIGSSGMCTEASIALMDSGGGGDDMWKGRAIAFLGGLIKPLVFLRDNGEILLGPDVIRGYFDLPVLERFVYDKEDVWNGGKKRDNDYFKNKYGRVWDVVMRPLRSFMTTIPGYSTTKLGKQEQKTLEQHGFITMQLARMFGDLADGYGHIMDTPLGQVDFYDVVINNRILVTLLPALERSPASLGMLGKIIVGGIKQMAAGCLGNRVEGLRREIVDARPTNAPVPFPTIFDEYGYYAVLGFSSMPAQARSLGFMVIFAAQDFASLKKSSPEEADQTWENTNIRGIGRITSGSAAETYKRMEELGGNVEVAEVASYERIQGVFGTKLRPSEQVNIVSRPRVNSDDLHSQADGEFHLFLGKKEQGGEIGRMNVVRVNAFYTDVKPVNKDKREQPSVDFLRINHFARVGAPSEVLDFENDASLFGESGLLAKMRDGSLARHVKDQAGFSNPQVALFEQLDSLNDALGSKRNGTVALGVMLLNVAVISVKEGYAEASAALSNKKAEAAPVEDESAKGKAERSASSAGNKSPSVARNNQELRNRYQGGRGGASRASREDMEARIRAMDEAAGVTRPIPDGGDQFARVPVRGVPGNEVGELVEAGMARGMRVNGQHANVEAAVSRSEASGEVVMESPVKPMDVRSVTDAMDAVGGKENAQEHSAYAKKVMDRVADETIYIKSPTPEIGVANVTDAESAVKLLAAGFVDQMKRGASTGDHVNG